MPTTVNKGYSVQTAGSNTGVWGTGSSDSLNEGMIELVDRNLGGTLIKSLAAGDVTLTGSEPQNVIIRLTGILPANRVVTNPNVGFYFVDNRTTGSFSVTVTNGVAGVVVPQGQRVILVADSTNGVQLFGGSLGFVPGTTKLTFVNSTVPTGWVADTSVTNGTLRIVGSAGGGSGGFDDFTTVFSGRTIAQANLPNVSFPVTDNGHAHQALRAINIGSNAGSDNGVFPGLWWGGATTAATSTSTTGISVSSGGAGTPISFAVKYRDAIIGTFGG